eukprot:948394-Lingulodinium_polyedra.AAC.1
MLSAIARPPPWRTAWRACVARRTRLAQRAPCGCRWHGKQRPAATRRALQWQLRACNDARRRQAVWSGGGNRSGER